MLPYGFGFPGNEMERSEFPWGLYMVGGTAWVSDGYGLWLAPWVKYSNKQIIGIVLTICRFALIQAPPGASDYFAVTYPPGHLFLLLSNCVLPGFYHVHPQDH